MGIASSLLAHAAAAVGGAVLRVDDTEVMRDEHARDLFFATPLVRAMAHDDVIAWGRRLTAGLGIGPVARVSLHRTVPRVPKRERAGYRETLGVALKRFPAGGGANASVFLPCGWSIYAGVSTPDTQWAGFFEWLADRAGRRGVRMAMILWDGSVWRWRFGPVPRDPDLYFAPRNRSRLRLRAGCATPARLLLGREIATVSRATRRIVVELPEGPASCAVTRTRRITRHARLPGFVREEVSFRAVFSPGVAVPSGVGQKRVTEPELDPGARTFAEALASARGWVLARRAAGPPGWQPRRWVRPKRIPGDGLASAFLARAAGYPTTPVAGEPTRVLWEVQAADGTWGLLDETPRRADELPVDVVVENPDYLPAFLLGGIALVAGALMSGMARRSFAPHASTAASR